MAEIQIWIQTLTSFRRFRLRISPYGTSLQLPFSHPIKDPDQRSFEVLSGVVYRPSSIEVVDQHHRQISHKSCVISALDDEQTSIKTYLYHAALKQRLTPPTQSPALADGALNCWSVISVLEPHCQTLELIVDWFHIGMRFQTVKNALGDSHADSLEKAKWSLWHGETEKALQKLRFMREAVIDEKHCSKLKGLHDYLQNNRAYLGVVQAKLRYGAIRLKPLPCKGSDIVYLY